MIRTHFKFFPLANARHAMHSQSKANLRVNMTTHSTNTALTFSPYCYIFLHKYIFTPQNFT
ncbi:hypothetical protein HH_1303 [Helicobacter hepaticus ATCC 51449]|uniref:Uncharacterized protein n=1 Tax=Helicobacter hepaticus (strain ATCC 51449 / 3B1) TaxID=235279 RepID=Q7VGL8_HELHP|nr:hypothetical protein HH_1303 [Helicobacter hepaticus ATCC 51449]